MYSKLIMTILCVFLPILGWTNVTAVKETTIDVENASLFCRIAGQGTPIFVLHGGPGMTQDYLQPYLWELTANHQVIFYDQRGCGKSTGELNAESINLVNYIKDLDNLRKALNFDKIIILGHSWGGFLGLNYTLAHPDHVEKLILSNSLGSTSESFTLFLEEYMKRMEPVKEEMAALEKSPGFASGDPAIFKQYCKLIFSKYCYNPQNADKLSMDYRQEDIVKFFQVHKIFDENLLMGVEFNLNSSLNRLKVPTLIIHGDVDPIPYSTVEEMHNNIPGSDYVLLKDCGHFPYVEVPEAYFQALNNFLK